MGQKVNPHGLRVGVIKGWDSRWFAKDELVGDLIVEDNKIRTYLKKTLYAAGIPQIEIERDNGAKVRVLIHCAKPGMIVGKGGAEIQKLEADVAKMIGKPVSITMIEVKSPDLCAQLVAESIAQQLEKRVSYRRAMKLAIGRAMKLGAKGIKVNCSGRLGGAEISRVEHYHEGTIPLQTLRADIDYGFTEAATTYGRIGVKVWLYKGEVLTGGPRTTSVETPKHDRRDRRDNRGGRGGFGDRNRRNDRGNGGFRRDNNGGDRRYGNNNGGDRRYGNRPQGGDRRYAPRTNAAAPAAAPKKEGGAE